MAVSKTAIRAANDPNIKYNGAFGGVAKAGDTIVSATEYLAKRSDYAYGKTYEKFLGPLGNNFANVAGGINSVTNNLTNTIDQYSDRISKTFEPISDSMGSLLGTLTGILKNPLGPNNGLGNVATNILNNISPGFGDKVNGTLTNLNLQAVANLPKQIFSSLDHLITAIDNILAVPLNMLAQIYYGYMAIMQSINKLISKVMDSIIEFFFDFLDSLIPINAILELLSQISTLANQIGGIASIFGANIVTGFTNQITSFSSQIAGVLNNPMNLIVSSLPSDVTNFVNLIQSPQQLINQFLPPELSQIFAQVSKVTGFGFNGNMGFSFQSILEGFQGGVIRSILTNFAAQYDILAPLLAGAGNHKPESFTPELMAGTFSSGALQDETKRGNNSPQYSEESKASATAPALQDYQPENKAIPDPVAFISARRTTS